MGFMKQFDIEHPGITNALRYGYPQPQDEPVVFCGECGKRIHDDEEVLSIMGYCFCERCVSRNTHSIYDLEVE